MPFPWMQLRPSLVMALWNVRIPSTSRGCTEAVWLKDGRLDRLMGVAVSQMSELPHEGGALGGVQRPRRGVVEDTEAMQEHKSGKRHRPSLKISYRRQAHSSVSLG